MTVEAEATVEAPSHAAFVWSRLASLVAVAPLGFWTVMHVWDNLAAFEGAAAWEAQVTGHAHPVAHVLTATIVFAPLILHTIWGVARLVKARPNLGKYRTYDNLKYVLQRLSAIGVLLFIGAHVWLAYLRPRLLLGHAEHFADIAREMRWHVPTLIVYLLGTFGVAYHLANGINTFAFGWGLCTTRRAVRRLEVASIALFVLLWAGSWAVIYALWRAGAAA
jgi:succinate dehydrogenase / fumarate reductase cytochrome b subunit